MTRIYNVGGMDSFGPIEPAAEPLAFASDWEAHAVALGVHLVRLGVLADVHFASPPLEAPGEPAGAAPYEAFFDALCGALAAAGVLDEAEVAMVHDGG